MRLHRANKFDFFTLSAELSIKRVSKRLSGVLNAIYAAPFNLFIGVLDCSTLHYPVPLKVSASQMA